MSAICGIYQFDGSQVDSAQLANLNQLLANFGEDRSRVWCNLVVGFGQQQTFATTEDQYEILPFFDRQRNVALAGDVRLFNRAELCSQLGLINSKNTTDSQIVLEAYLKYGKNFPQYLLGEFSLALYDTNNLELLLVSDHFSSRPLYYYFDNKVLIFASNLSAVAQFTVGKSSINLKKVARSKYFTSTEQIGETYFNNILFLPAASILTISQVGQSILKRYWRPVLNQIRVYRSQDDFVEEFQSLFSRIIGDHCRTIRPVCSLPSGGLDSTSISAMICHVLSQQKRSAFSFSAVLPSGNNFTVQDERYYIDLLVKDNLEKHYIVDDFRGPFDNLTDIVDSPELTSRRYLYYAFNAAARNLGSRTIIDGCFGEFGPTYWGDEYLSELFKKFQLVGLLQNIKQHRKLFGRSLKSIIFQDVVKPNLPRALQLKLSTRRDLAFSNNLDLVRPEFVAQWVSVDSLQVEAACMKKIGTARSTDCRVSNLEMFSWLMDRETSPLISEANQPVVRYSYPFLDRRMVEFCLSLPNDLRFKDGYRRYAIRKGMQGLMPDELRFRTSKEPFSPDYNLRYARQLKLAREIVAEFKNNTLVCEVINIPQLEKYLQIQMSSNRSNSKNDFIGMHIVPRAIYLASFLNNNS